MRILQVICAAYNRPIRLRLLIDCFILQTDPNWKLHIVHDGHPIPEIGMIISLYNDPRITFFATEERKNNFGHPNRRMMLSKLALNHRDFVLITNDDNYYVPQFVQRFLHSCNRNTGFVYCDTVHSYLDYNVLVSEIKLDHIDMGSFIVRLDVAKKVGFESTAFNADGIYAVACANYCHMKRLRIIKISKPLFVHN
jgi:hypothetical protein